MRHFVLLAGIAGLVSIPVLAQDISASTEITLPDARGMSVNSGVDDYPTEPQSDRKTWTVRKTERGTSVRIEEADVIKFCGDRDGCEVRIGLHNWDDTGRVASRETLMFYNRRNNTWRASLGDTAGTNENNPTEHVLNAWSCYFTDGRYENWADRGDTDNAFGLLSWNQYNADCFLTIVD